LLKNDRVKIGYVGTLTRSKLHPMFPYICRAVLEKIPNAEFYLLGDKEDGAWIGEQTKAVGIDSRVHLVGFSSNVNEWLDDFDIFGYPLNPYHFATTENSILEAMAAGLPVVLLDQATEKYIITSDYDGMLADGTEEYVRCMERLSMDKALRKRLGTHARESVYRKFPFENNLANFQNQIMEIGSLPKKQVVFKDVLGACPYEWFISAVNASDRKIIDSQNYEALEPIFKEKSKSSVRHFADTYPEDVRLVRLAGRIDSALNV
jgi:glycosyltransferase involved in cell wall biosynthesis